MSIVARHLRSWHYLDCKGMAAQMGLGLQFADLASPGPVAHLASVAFSGLPGDIAARRVVQRHTLLPYFLAFTAPSAAKAQMTRLAARRQRNLRSLRLEAMGYARPSTLQVCVECVEQDWQVRGQPYWHRQHQLPGISCCAVHGVRLRDTNSPARRIRWIDLKALTLTPAEAADLPLVAPTFTAELEAAIQRESLLALKSGAPGGRFISTKVRREALAVLGYGSEAQIAATKFVTDFEQWIARCTVLGVPLGPHRWTRNLFTELGGPSAPLQQILLREFIQDRLANHDVFAKWAPITD